MGLTNTDEKGWTTVSYKKRSNNTKKEDNKKLKNKRINKEFDKTKVKLWYDKDSWQHNVLINNYIYEDNTDVSSKFDLSELVEEYSKAKSNYDKNGVIRKLTKVVNDEKWNTESLLVTLKIKPEEIIIPVKAEEKVEEKVEVEALEEKTEVLEKVNKQHIFTKTRMFDSSISFADMIKKN